MFDSNGEMTSSARRLRLDRDDLAALADVTAAISSVLAGGAARCDVRDVLHQR